MQNGGINFFLKIIYFKIAEKIGPKKLQHQRLTQNHFLLISTKIKTLVVFMKLIGLGVMIEIHHNAIF